MSIGSMFGCGAANPKPAKTNMQKSQQQNATGTDKILSILNFEKNPKITIDQLWYRGLPNMARHCLWPILIGNSLNINQANFDLVMDQVKDIRRKIHQLIEFKNKSYINNRDSIDSP